MPAGTTVKHAVNDVIYDVARVILITHSTVIKRNIFASKESISSLNTSMKAIFKSMVPWHPCHELTITVSSLYNWKILSIILPFLQVLYFQLNVFFLSA
jgi:hypothetical protein